MSHTSYDWDAPAELQHNITYISTKIQDLIEEVQKVVIGQDVLIRNMVIALFARGHIILEGVPGLAKTLSIETLAKTLGVDFSRLQFTPDLLPSDLIGSQIRHQQQHQFMTKKWPIFAHFVLADEINRAPAKVQSALLECMAERQVTIGDTRYELEPPFVVMATQNPVEQEGTYSLPEAQLDRFLLKTVLTYPSEEEEIEIMKRFSESGTSGKVSEIIPHEEILQMQGVIDQVHVSPAMYTYIKDIVIATRDPKSKWCDRLAHYIQFGWSPRASLALVRASKVMAAIHGRTFIIPEDVQEIVYDVLRHRLILTFDALADGVDVETVIDEIVKTIPTV